MATKRQSNIELLRIVAMLMVVGVHIDFASIGKPDASGLEALSDSRVVWQYAVESLTLLGVNLFTMISGYFGIRLRLRTMVTFLAQCIFYSVLIYLFGVAAGIRPFNVGQFLTSFLVLSVDPLWYVPAYFLLCLLSPLLNAGIEALPKRDMRNLLLVLVAFTCWTGWYWGGHFNPTGYTIMQLVVMYLIARYIGLYYNNNVRAMWAGRHAWLLTAAGYAGIFLALVFMQLKWKAIAYNSPFAIIASIGVFMLFARMHLQSRAVNWIAKSAFAVYLIHQHPMLFGTKFKPLVQSLWAEMPLWEFTLAAIGIMLATYAIAIALDTIRRGLFAALPKISFVKHHRGE